MNFSVAHIANPFASGKNKKTEICFPKKKPVVKKKKKLVCGRVENREGVTDSKNPELRSPA